MAEQSAERFNSSGGNLLIFVRLHTRNAYRAHTLSLHDDRHAALHRQHRSAWTHELDVRPWSEKF